MISAKEARHLGDKYFLSYQDTLDALERIIISYSSNGKYSFDLNLYNDNPKVKDSIGQHLMRIKDELNKNGFHHIGYGYMQLTFAWY